MHLRHPLVALCALLLSTSCLADGLIMEAGLHVGGDKIVEVTFTDGSKESIKAGQLASLDIGLYTSLGASSQARLTVGLKIDSIRAENGDLEFKRAPVNLLFFTRVGQGWMLGAGVTRHSSPRLVADAPGIGLNGTARLDDANGTILAFDYNSRGDWSSAWYVGGRITMIDYENQLGSVDGGSVGVVIGYLF